MLTEYDPARRIVTSPGLDDALDELGAAIVAQPRDHKRPDATRPRHRARRTLARYRSPVLVAAALAVLAGGAAAASRLLLNAHTGTYPRSHADVVSGGSGENLNLAAPNGRTVALAVSVGVPYPKGYESWRRWLTTTEIRESAPQPCPPGAGGGMCPSVISTSALRAQYAMSATCAWTVAWRQATVAGDRSSAAHAALAISQAPGWAASPPAPVSAHAGRMDPRSRVLASFVAPYLAAIRGGDRIRVDQLLGADTSGVPCWQYDPAFAPTADRQPQPGSAFLTFLDRTRG